MIHELIDEVTDVLAFTSGIGGTDDADCLWVKE
jgi:hypothetical protein